jgi:hypothetical protein
MARPLTPGEERRIKEGIPKETVVKESFWWMRTDGIAVLPPVGNTAGTFCILEHKRMSDVCERYLVRAKSTAENQYVSLRSVISTVIQCQDWKVEQNHDFGAASDCLSRKRAKTDARYFQAQLIGRVNFPWMSEAHEMPAQAISRALVHQNLPEAGFGVPEIYEKVPREDEEDEFRLGNKTDDGFEGEDTCEQGWEEFGEESE